MKKNFVWSGNLFAVFVLFTLLVAGVQVKPTGPQGVEVGLSELNGWVWNGIGCHPFFDRLTDGILLLCLLVIGGQGIEGMKQWVKRKSLRRVDRDLWALAPVYGLMAGAYQFFEIVVINFRPVGLEASYPSSHVLLAVVVLGMAAGRLRKQCPGRKNLRRFFDLLSALMVVGRCLSGLHWLTDILGSGLLGQSLVFLYRGMLDLEKIEPK